MAYKTIISYGLTYCDISYFILQPWPVLACIFLPFGVWGNHSDWSKNTFVKGALGTIRILFLPCLSFPRAACDCHLSRKLMLVTHGHRHMMPSQRSYSVLATVIELSSRWSLFTYFIFRTNKINFAGEFTLLCFSL